MRYSSPPPSRRGLSAALMLCAALALFVAACGGGSSDSGSSAKTGSSKPTVDLQAELKKPANLTMWTWVPGIEKEVKLFEQAYPNIKVKVVNAGQGAAQYQKLRTVLKSGKGAPDVAQIEFQYIPSFVLTKSLLDLSKYFPVDQFSQKYPDWVASQVVSDNHIWAVPQDTGPMGMLYRKDLLDKAGIKPPTTWEEFATAAREYHKKNPGSYLANMPSNDQGEWIGLFWQNGARPFAQTGQDQIKLDLTDPAAKKVADYWTPLIKEGVISTDPDFTDAWYQGLASGKYASWLTAAWGPVFLQGTAKKTSGNWRAAPLPQWSDGAKVSGNWGGSTDAVLASSKYPAQAAELARWINQEHEPALELANKQFLFPATNAILQDPSFIDLKAPFYGGQQVNKLFVGIANTVPKDFQWSPIHDFVINNGNDTFGGAISKKGDLGSALDTWNNALIGYAKQQGFTVSK
jgi:multiple sugar transport system substrate-binding protein